MMLHKSLTMTKLSRLLVLIGCVSMSSLSVSEASANDRVNAITSVPNLISLWGFDQAPGQRTSVGAELLTLAEKGSHTIQCVEGGPITGYSAALDGTNYFDLNRSVTGDLNIHGEDAEVTVVSWIKLSQMKTIFVAGFWEEALQRRQYGLFINLPYYGGYKQVCGHVSATGGPSPGEPYSKDYSASLSTVPTDEWVTVGFTYDGTYARSYIDGVMEPRIGDGPDDEDKNPYYYPDGLYDGLGDAGGSDFTIGAVNAAGMTHFLNGQLGGVAIYDRALTDEEMAGLVYNTNYEAPEPASLALLGTALGAAACKRPRRRNRV